MKNRDHQLQCKNAGESGQGPLPEARVCNYIVVNNIVDNRTFHKTNNNIVQLYRGQESDVRNPSTTIPKEKESDDDQENSQEQKHPPRNAEHTADVVYPSTSCSLREDLNSNSNYYGVEIWKWNDCSYANNSTLTQYPGSYAVPYNTPFPTQSTPDVVHPEQFLSKNENSTPQKFAEKHDYNSDKYGYPKTEDYKSPNSDGPKNQSYIPQNQNQFLDYKNIHQNPYYYARMDPNYYVLQPCLPPPEKGMQYGPPGQQLQHRVGTVPHAYAKPYTVPNNSNNNPIPYSYSLPPLPYYPPGQIVSETPPRDAKKRKSSNYIPLTYPCEIPGNIDTNEQTETVVLQEVQAAIQGGQYENVFKLLTGNCFSRQYHEMLQSVWLQAVYSCDKAKRGKPPNAVDRYRLRRKFPFPVSIWDGERTLYCYKETARSCLEEFYASSPYPSPNQKAQLACSCKLTYVQVSNWFKNKRMRDKEKNRMLRKPSVKHRSRKVKPKLKSRIVKK